MKYRYYSFSEIIKNIIAVIYTRLFFPKARLIRLPIYIRQKSQMKYGENLTTGYSCRIDMIGEDNNIKLEIGDNCTIGDYCQISASSKITIGNNVLIARNVYISDTSHGDYENEDIRCTPNVPPNERPLISKDVYIGNNVWIGANVSILSGVTIGDGCIIGANAVVNKDIPENNIAVGIPAKQVKTFNKELGKWVKIDRL